ARGASQQVSSQVGNVLAALAQRRQANLESVDAEIEIFPKLILLNHFPEVPVGGAEDAHAGAEWLRLTDAADFPRLQEAEQFDLDVLVQLADFVQEQRSAIGHFEEAFMIAVGTRERAFAVAEQLAL